MRKKFSIWTITCKNKNGSIAWKEKDILNALVDEGEENLLDVYLRNQNVPSTFYIRVFNQVSDPDETHGLTDITGEPSGNGYVAQEVERSSVGFPTLVLDSGDYQAQSKDVIFEATGGSWTVNKLMLATSSDNSGKLIAWVALSTSRTVLNGQELEVSIKIKLS